MILFGFLALLILLAAHGALFIRLCRPIQRPTIRRAAGALIAISFIASGGGMALSRVFPNGFTSGLQRMGYVCLPLILYLILILALVDAGDLIRRLLKRLRKKRLTTQASQEKSAEPSTTLPSTVEPSEVQVSRRKFLQVSAGASVALASVTTFGGMDSAFSCSVKEVEIRLEKLPQHMDGFSLALLSDIHVGGWIGRSFVEDLVRKANALNVDAVLICGDLVDGSVEELSSMVAPLAGLKSRLGTFFTIGNHEIYSGAEAWCAFLKTLGIRVLRNERVELDGIDLLGVDDITCARHGMLPGYSLEEAMKRRRQIAPAILLTHQPRGFSKAAAMGVDLQLSGHTHGGQMFPFQSIARRANEGFLAGLYRVGTSQIYVTRGCGFWGPPVRVMAPSEITKITLRQMPDRFP